VSPISPSAVGPGGRRAAIALDSSAVGSECADSFAQLAEMMKTVKPCSTRYRTMLFFGCMSRM
jgi:hypothetical protein